MSKFTVKSVLTSAIAADRASLIAALDRQACEAREHGEICSDRKAHLAAYAAFRRMRNCWDAHFVLMHREDDERAADDIIALGCGPMVVTFNEACRMLGLSPREASEVIQNDASA